VTTIDTRRDHARPCEVEGCKRTALWWSTTCERHLGGSRADEEKPGAGGGAPPRSRTRKSAANLAHVRQFYVPAKTK